MIGFTKQLVHKSIEGKVKASHFDTVLELGAGNGEHKRFVTHTFHKYIEIDIRNKNTIADFQTIQTGAYFCDAVELKPIPDDSIDRLIATCLIVHLSNPELALKNWRRVISPGGELTIFVPSEPGFMLRFFRFFSTARKAKKFGFCHSQIHLREHINSYLYINMLIREVFENFTISRFRFPFSFLSWNFSLYDVYVIKKP